MPPSEVKQLGRNGDGSLLWHCWGWVREQILNGTSAQIRYTVPFTSVYAGKSGQKTNQKQTLLKLSTTQKKQTTQNTAKLNYPGSVAFYNTRPGNEVGLFHNAAESTRGFVTLLDLMSRFNYWKTLITTSHNVHMSLKIEQNYWRLQSTMNKVTLGAFFRSLARFDKPG